MGKVTFSGIQPSGKLHIGNYLGAVRHWASGQKDGMNLFCVVDLHAITVQQDPAALRESTLSTAALLMASGISAIGGQGSSKTILFVQSQNPDHADLGWVLNNYVSMGQMNRMTQFKEKSENKGFVSVGLFDYPALMAADILLYDTTHVPVGEDQKQHVELARDIAERFNARHGETFILPGPVIPEQAARVMSLQDPTKKMSKSDPKADASIFLFDDPETIRRKVVSAVTDSGGEIKGSDDPAKAGINNLLTLYSELSGKSVDELEKEFQGKGYGEFKSALSDLIVGSLEPLQAKYREIRENDEQLRDTLREGAARAKEISGVKLREVYNKIGFIT